MRFGILASGSGSNMEAIAQAIDGQGLKGEIGIVIYNEPGAYVQHRAAVRRIPVVHLNHRDFGSREALDHQLMKVLNAHGVDLVLMAGWMRVVTPVLIDGFPERILNIHPSLLPSFRGMHAIQQALDYGVKITGCTVHVVVPDVDAGRILAQAAVPILPDDTPHSLRLRIQSQEHRIYPEAIADYQQHLSQSHVLS
ncbi:MAG: phosphoribosylglycinamide formyltransferase [Oscillatoriales cyanobacterium SM2_2_1]|nr:phosphoribosylglycinamide formyltransferase [Oscillatoriales cyanobacterium SM2_2_1]